MNRDEIIENLKNAPPIGPGPERVDYFHRLYVQVTGWITAPDRDWLCNFLPEVALAYPKEMTILEVGTFLGSTARGLIALTGGRITCMDMWVDFHPDNGDGKAITMAGCKTGPEGFWKVLGTANGPDLTSQVDALITGDSKAEGPKWTVPLDLLFVDGDHSFQGAWADISNFAKHVIAGGYCLVDDLGMPPVKRACDEYFHAGWEVVRIPDGGANIGAWKKQ